MGTPQLHPAGGAASLALLPEDHGNRGLRGEDVFRYFADPLRGECRVDLGKESVGVCGVAEEEIQGGVAGVGGGGLLLDGPIQGRWLLAQRKPMSTDPYRSGT